VTWLALLGAWMLLIALFTVLFVMPRWCFRSVHRHRMWRLRDDIVDKVIDGVLPADHPAVRQLVGRVNGSIRLAPKITLLRLLVIDKVTGKTSPEVRAVLDEHAGCGPCDMTELTEEQCDLIARYNDRINILRIGTTLTGSWLGIAVVAAVVPLVAVTPAARTIRQALGRAVDEVSATRFGRRVGESARLEELHVTGRSQFA
jgi:hypothetical protein